MRFSWYAIDSHIYEACKICCAGAHCGSERSSTLSLLRSVTTMSPQKPRPRPTSDPKPNPTGRRRGALQQRAQLHLVAVAQRDDHVAPEAQAAADLTPYT